MKTDAQVRHQFASCRRLLRASLVLWPLLTIGLLVSAFVDATIAMSVLLVVWIGFSVVAFDNWACPACHRRLWANWNPEVCPWCGRRFR